MREMEVEEGIHVKVRERGRGRGRERERGISADESVLLMNMSYIKRCPDREVQLCTHTYGHFT